MSCPGNFRCCCRISLPCQSLSSCSTFRNQRCWRVCNSMGQNSPEFSQTGTDLLRRHSRPAPAHRHPSGRVSCPANEPGRWRGFKTIWWYGCYWYWWWGLDSDITFLGLQIDPHWIEISSVRLKGGGSSTSGWSWAMLGQSPSQFGSRQVSQNSETKRQVWSAEE